MKGLRVWRRRSERHRQHPVPLYGLLDVISHSLRTILLLTIILLLLFLLLLLSLIAAMRPPFSAMDVALGQVMTGVFTNSDELWDMVNTAGQSVDEPMWRMPLHPEYRKMMDSQVADIINAGESRSAGACTAAAFLQEFTKAKSWMHMDVAGVMTGSDPSYLDSKAMSGRPTRALVQFVRTLCAPRTHPQAGV